MPEIARTRYTPIQRQTGVPATMRVAVELGYVQTCPDCCRIAAEISAASVADATVTRFALLPGRKHCHEVTEGATALPGLADATKSLPEGAMPVSDTNGDAPEAVDAMLFAQSGLTPNGFDAGMS